MKLRYLATSAASMFVAASLASATPFGATQTFESDTPGTLPPDWRVDGNSGWGQAEVVTSGTDGVFAGPSGGNQFVKLTPGALDSYQSGDRNGPRTLVGGGSSPFPVPGDTYSVFRDIYFQPLLDVNQFWMQNTIRKNVEPAQILTEASWRFTTGDETWKLQIGGGDVAGVNLDTGAWYTLETIWDRSQTLVQTTFNVYEAGGGALLYTETLGTYNNALSDDLGGSAAHSWFTVWNNNGPDAVYADNFGTVPEPAALSLVGLAGLGLLRRRRAVR